MFLMDSLGETKEKGIGNQGLLLRNKYLKTYDRIKT